MGTLTNQIMKNKGFIILVVAAIMAVGFFGYSAQTLISGNDEGQLIIDGTIYADVITSIQIEEINNAVTVKSLSSRTEALKDFTTNIDIRTVVVATGFTAASDWKNSVVNWELLENAGLGSGSVITYSSTSNKEYGEIHIPEGQVAYVFVQTRYTISGQTYLLDGASVEFYGISDVTDPIIDDPTITEPEPDVLISISPLSGSAPLEVRFDADVTGDIVEKLWDFGDGNTHSGYTAYNIYHDPGTYQASFYVLDANDYYSTQYFTITVTDEHTTIGDEHTTIGDGTLSITATPNNGSAPLTVNFTGQVNDYDVGDTFTYSWDFGDNTNISTFQNPTHTYIDNGTYTAILTVTNQNDISASADIEITVGRGYNLNIILLIAGITFLAMIITTFIPQFTPKTKVTIMILVLIAGAVLAAAVYFGVPLI